MENFLDTIRKIRDGRGNFIEFILKKKLAESENVALNL